MDQTLEDASAKEPPGATVVISHRVRKGRQAEYERWLDEIGPLCRASPGHLDWQIIRPIEGLSDLNTVVIRFDTTANLQRWMDSATRRRLIDQVRPLLVQDDAFLFRSGLEFWFAPQAAQAMVPVRWKQFLITWSAIYPLVLGVSLVVAWLMQPIAGVQNRYLTTLIVTGGVVALMVYAVMPRYTHWVRSWLFR